MPSPGTARRFRYSVHAVEHEVMLTPDAPTTLRGQDRGPGYRVGIDGSDYDGGRLLAVLARPDGATTLVAGDMRASVYFARRGSDLLAFWRGSSYLLRKPQPLTVEAASHASDLAAGRQTLAAPMAGTVLKVQVSEGDRVEAHQPLAVLGAMKMEHAITAPFLARVVRVHHASGDVVPGGEPLLDLETI
jgi:3-methylcrotonyl-CoA carboxylase alpha subunit